MQGRFFKLNLLQKESFYLLGPTYMWFMCLLFVYLQTEYYFYIMLLITLYNVWDHVVDSFLMFD